MNLLLTEAWGLGSVMRTAFFFVASLYCRAATTITAALRAS